jgi:peptide/nickel transport system permease protein
LKTFIIKRLLQAVAVCLVISAMSFFLLFLNTDPVLLLLPPEADIQDIQLYKEQMGLDKPVVVQYLRYLERVVLHADFGESFVTRAPVIDEILVRFPNTIILALSGLLFANVIAIVVGILSAVRRYSLIDNISTFVALIGQAMPNFWFGIMLIIIFGVWLRWFPISGSGTWAHLVLPTVTLGTGILPINLRLVRSGMLDVLNQDYIRTARAKGLSEPKVLIKHAFKNAAIPVITVTGMQLAALLGGAVITETVFAWPGVGRLAVDSIRIGDFPVVQAIVIMFSLLAVSGNLIADIAAAFIDPRIRLE